MTDAHPDLDTIPSARLREDAQLLRRAAARLSRPYLIRRLAMVVIGIVVFWVVASLILAFGRSVSYAGLGAPDAAAVSFLNRINVYIWWVLVAVVGLITLFWLKAAWSAGGERENAVAVSTEELRGLAQQVTAPTLAVMRWVWADHSEPFAIGDLRRTVSELRTGRVEKMLAVREQQTLLRAQLPLWNPRGGLSQGFAGSEAERQDALAATVTAPAVHDGEAGRQAERGEPFLGAARPS